MPGCEKMFDDLSALVDGELDAADSARVRDHVAACDACRAELDGLQRLESVLRRSRLVVEERPRLSMFPKITAAAAAILVAAVVYLNWPDPEAKVRELVGQYVVAPTESERESVARQILAYGDVARRVLVQGVESDRPELQIASVRILARSPDGADWLMNSGAAYGALGDGSYDVLNRPAADLDRALFDVSHQEPYKDFAASELASNNLFAMLLSSDPNLRAHAAATLEHNRRLTGGRLPKVNVPLRRLAFYLDSPDIGDMVYEALKQSTKQDFGRDKDAWLDWLRRTYNGQET